MIIPSIDLMDGKAVQLIGGREKTLESTEDPVELAKEFNRYGEVAVVDLDAALGKGDNLDIIKKICKVADCRVGGGIRTVDDANAFLRAGAKKIIMGTKATPKFLKQLPRERVIVAIDTKDSRVVTEGWTKSTGKTPQEMVRELQPYCSGFLFTNVNREGKMEGPDMSIVREIRKTVKNDLTIAGGITTIGEIQELEDMGTNAQVGMAIYTGRLDLTEAFVSLLDFERNQGLLPTIVQDDKGQVLMLAFSDRDAVMMALATGKGTYYSRSRQKIWVKGQERSGNYQEIISARYDCDRDTLLYRVRQKNVACHTGRYSCFNDKEFSLEGLYDVISDRIENPRKDSYTSEIGKSGKKIKEKIVEEAQEVASYTSCENLVWEIADLTYFVMVLMAKNGITLQDIENELWRRRR